MNLTFLLVCIKRILVYEFNVVVIYYDIYVLKATTDNEMFALMLWKKSRLLRLVQLTKRIPRNKKITG